MITSDNISEVLRTLAHIKPYISLCLKIAKDLCITFCSAQSSFTVLVHLAVTPAITGIISFCWLRSQGSMGTTGGPFWWFFEGLLRTWISEGILTCVISFHPHKHLFYRRANWGWDTVLFEVAYKVTVEPRFGNKRVSDCKAVLFSTCQWLSKGGPWTRGSMSNLGTC